MVLMNISYGGMERDTKTKKFHKIEIEEGLKDTTNVCILDIGTLIHDWGLYPSLEIVTIPYNTLRFVRIGYVGFPKIGPFIWGGGRVGKVELT